MTTEACAANVLKNLIESKKFINDFTISYYSVLITKTERKNKPEK